MTYSSLLLLVRHLLLLAIFSEEHQPTYIVGNLSRTHANHCQATDRKPKIMKVFNKCCFFDLRNISNFLTFSNLFNRWRHNNCAHFLLICFTPSSLRGKSKKRSVRSPVRSFLVTTSKALVTRSDALVPSSVLAPSSEALCS